MARLLIQSSDIFNRFTFYLNNNISSAILVEFAVTTAMLATLALTAILERSSLTKDTKGRRTREHIDKILFASKKFYEETSKSKGRGRFPGKKKPF